MSIQQLMLGVGASKKTYLDDVFSTQIYNGNGGTQTITNGIDLSGEGGAILTKRRDSSSGSGPWFNDTVRGITKYISTSDSGSESDNSSSISAVSTTGYSLGSFSGWNNSAGNYASWTFRKAPGFFTIKEYTGSGSTQSISHDLGSIPGCIMVKRTDSSADWGVYHRGQNGGVDPEDYRLRLNSNTTENNDTYWGDTAPTATHFTVGDSHTEVNASGGTYIAYIFAGGESTAATARSVDYDGSDDNTVWQGLSGDNADDLTFGTGDFTVEGWVKPDAMAGITPTICDFRDQSADSSTTSGFWLGATNGGKLRMYSGSAFLDDPPVSLYVGQWSHFAVVRSSGTIKIFVNGIQTGNNVSNSTNFNNSNNRKMRIGAGYQGSDLWNGKISNFRITKGQALYTTAFKPSTEPLTTTSQGATASNVKLLCCNNSSTTGSTVTPVTPANNGSPTASTDSPFDDPAGFVFGDAGNQNVIKCGSFTTDSNGAATIDLGWEPQWILHKASSASGGWSLIDNMRGWPTEGINTTWLNANSNGAESNSNSNTSLTSTGFKVHLSSYWQNMTRVFVAIRRSDGYVGKLADAGTDVFTTAASNSGSKPGFTSGFPVDFYLYRKPTASSGWQADWGTYARLIATKKLKTNTSDAEGSDSSATFAFNNGVQDYDGFDTSYQAWMWKRHAGFDCICFKGDGVAGRQIPHSLNGVPEMMWVKNRDSAEDWMVYHSGLQSGSGPANSPQNYMIRLNLNNGVSDTNTAWNDTAPTATHFTLGNRDDVNKNNEDHIALLFRSVTGISKIGTYTGNHEARTITTGFQPRFLIIKGQGTGSDNEWVVLDTTRGWASGVDNYLVLNDTAAQTNALDAGQPTSTGFTLTGGDDYRRWNDYGVRYIYYAHA